LCISSQGQDLYSHQKLNMYIYRFSSESGYRRRRRRRRRRQAGQHSTTTRATYRQLVAAAASLIGCDSSAQFEDNPQSISGQLSRQSRVLAALSVSYETRRHLN